MWGKDGALQAPRERVQGAGISRSLICFVAGGARMSAYWIWWIAAAALVAAELLTGTFYLLVVGIALACAGLAALSGAGATLQWLTAGMLSIAGTVVLQRWKRRLSADTPAQPNLDIGQMVRVQ